MNSFVSVKNVHWKLFTMTPCQNNKGHMSVLSINKFFLLPQSYKNEKINKNQLSQF